ncbi:hypothetical protein B296_00057031, partial [Ensete ventricosum]
KNSKEEGLAVAGCKGQPTTAKAQGGDCQRRLQGTAASGQRARGYPRRTCKGRSLEASPQGVTRGAPARGCRPQGQRKRVKERVRASF